MDLLLFYFILFKFIQEVLLNYSLKDKRKRVRGSIRTT